MTEPRARPHFSARSTGAAAASLAEKHFETDFPSGRPFQVVSLGMNAVDWICRLPDYPKHNSKMQLDEVVRLGGGPAATAAALCARYGLSVRYVGRVGDDEIGRFSAEDLAKENMELSCLEVIQGAVTQFAVILVDRPTGERTVLWRRDPKLNYGPGELNKEWIAAGQVLHMDGHELHSRAEAARWAKAAGMIVSLDIDNPGPGVDEVLALTDFALPTEAFVCRYGETTDWRQGLRQVARACPGFVAATRGKRGVGVHWEGEIVEVPSFPIRAIESTGAGDVFHGAFVYSLFQDWTIERSLRFANAAGALACTRVGARGGIPPVQEILRKIGEATPLPEGREEAVS